MILGGIGVKTYSDYSSVKAYVTGMVERFSIINAL